MRTRLSIQSASFAELGDKPEKLLGMWGTLVRMYKTEGGVSALYRGIIPTVAGVAPYVSRRFQLRRCCPLTSSQGRSQLYGVRVRTDSVHTRGRTESQCCQEAPGWRHIWSCGPDMHIPLVSLTIFSDLVGAFDADDNPAMCCVVDFRSTRCQGWDINTRAFSTRSASSSVKRASGVSTRASYQTC